MRTESPRNSASCHFPFALLRALLELTVAAALELGRSQEAAQLLSLWRLSRAQPQLQNQELEQLRAELTGLQSAATPGLEKRLADTRAEFLVKLSQLRQRHPEIESALSAQGDELLALQKHLPPATLLVQYTRRLTGCLFSP